MIISGGVNIYPAEIEACSPSTRPSPTSASSASPTTSGASSVKAAVELAPGFAPAPALEAELLAFARERLAAYKVPRSIDFEAALPRTPAGKLYVRRLKRPLLAGPRPPHLNEVGSHPHVAEETRPRDRGLVHARRGGARSSLGTRCKRCGSRLLPARGDASAATRPARAATSRRSRSRAAAGSGPFTEQPLRAAAAVRRRRDPFEPYAIAAVELERREDGGARPGRARRRRRATSRSGMEMELVLDTLYEDDEQRVRRLEVEAGAEGGVSPMSERQRGRDPRRRHAPLGQVGPQLRRVRRGGGAATRSPTPGSSGRTCSSSPAATRSATATRATSPARSFAQALGWNGAQVASSYGACATGAQAIERGARADPRRALRRRARRRRRHHAEGLLRADRRRRAHAGPRLAALPPARRDEPRLLRPLRAPPHGPLRRDRARLRAGEGQEQPPRRSRTRTRATARLYTLEEVLASPMVSRSAAPARDLRDQRRRRGARAVEHGVRAQAHDEAGHDRRRLDGDAALPADA